MTPARREHIERVAELAGRWAIEMGVPESERHRWLRAVWLHDALRDAPAEELMRWAPDAPGPPNLGTVLPAPPAPRRRGRPIAACSTPCAITRSGSPNGTWSGRILYCADYLEPGRKHDREWRADLAARLPSADGAGACRQVATRAGGAHGDLGPLLLEPTVRFWNSLVAESSGSY